MTSGALADLAWDRLRLEPLKTSTDLGVPSFALPVSTGAGSARLAIGPDDCARLLLPVAAGEPFPKMAEARGLTLTDTVYMLQGKPHRFIDIGCKSRSLEPVFKDVVAEVLRRIAEKETPAQAVEGAVKDFRSLLLGARTQDISTESAIGILGELVLLERLLMIDNTSWRSWAGPLGGRHDFRASDHAVEVKSSLRSHRRTVEISALDQLAEPTGGSLVLFHQIFEENAGGDLTVPALAAKVIAQASDSDSVTDLLSIAGYDALFDSRWDSFRFSALADDAYRVAPGFPRLVPSNFESSELPPGVSHFRYTVDLSAASQFILRKDAFHDYLASFISCLNQP